MVARGSPLRRASLRRCCRHLARCVVPLQALGLCSSLRVQQRHPTEGPCLLGREGQPRPFGHATWEATPRDSAPWHWVAWSMQMTNLPLWCTQCGCPRFPGPLSSDTDTRFPWNSPKPVLVRVARLVLPPPISKLSVDACTVGARSLSPPPRPLARNPRPSQDSQASSRLNALPPQTLECLKFVASRRPRRRQPEGRCSSTVKRIR